MQEVISFHHLLLRYIFNDSDSRSESHGSTARGWRSTQAQRGSLGLSPALTAALGFAGYVGRTLRKAHSARGSDPQPSLFLVDLPELQKLIPRTNNIRGQSGGPRGRAAPDQRRVRNFTADPYSLAADLNILSQGRPAF